MLLKIFNTLFRHDFWGIGVVNSPISSFLNPDFKPEVIFLQHPKKGKSFADPFGIFKDGKLTILCEDFDYSPGKGIISAVQPSADFSSLSKAKALEFPFHASYPFILKHNNEIFCIPETSEANEVCLYKATEFPKKLAKVATIIKGISVLDPTVFFYEKKWWLFGSPKEKGSRELFIWHANDLFGPWEPHKKNPVKRNISSSRPAGTPFLYNGFLYRPSQDCSSTYGGRVIINRVKTLTPDNFEEEIASVVEPIKGSPFPDGIHTLSAAGNITLIDGKRHVFRTADFFRNAARMPGAIARRILP